MELNEKLMTREEVCALFDRHPSTLRNWQRSFGFPEGIPKGDVIFYDAAEVRQWILHIKDNPTNNPKLNARLNLITSDLRIIEKPPKKQYKRRQPQLVPQQTIKTPAINFLDKVIEGAISAIEAGKCPQMEQRIVNRFLGR